MKAAAQPCVHFEALSGETRPARIVARGPLGHVGGPNGSVASVRNHRRLV